MYREKAIITNRNPVTWFIRCDYLIYAAFELVGQGKSVDEWQEELSEVSSFRDLEETFTSEH